MGHYKTSVKLTTQLLTPLMVYVLIIYTGGGTNNSTSTAKNFKGVAIV